MQGCSFPSVPVLEFKQRRLFELLVIPPNRSSEGIGDGHTVEIEKIRDGGTPELSLALRWNSDCGGGGVRPWPAEDREEEKAA